MTTRKILTSASLACWFLACAPPTSAHPHHPVRGTNQMAALSGQGAPAVVAGGRVVSGTAPFRFEYVPEKLVLPMEVRMRHGHGLCHDNQGRIYFSYEAERVDAATRCLVRFEADGTRPVLLGQDNRLAVGVPHGLNIQVDAQGQAHLYHANNDATVLKSTLDGEVKWVRRWPADLGNYKPTDVVVPPGSARVFVADGYGSSMIHALKDADGIYAGKSWGGLGGSHGEFNCPHGITYDPRRKLLLVSDRGNKRLEYYTLNGQYHSTVEAREIISPCNADVRGDEVLVPNLDGDLVILDRDNKVVSVVEVGRLLGSQGFKHPHDAIWLPNGDIVVCTWNPGRLGYFKRLP